MPLQDHFHPPLSRRVPWGSFHSAWINALVDHLNSQLLPPGFFALPHVEFGGAVEIDAAALQSPTATVAGSWMPPRPALVAAVDFVNLDLFEVEVHSEEEGRVLAALELVSPANKDRPSHRDAFVRKCATYLQQGLGLVVVDVVTSRHANLHQELLRLLNVPAEQPLADLYAAAYHAAGTNGTGQLEVWPESLALGQSLPTVPLWLKSDLVLPLNLDISYQATFSNLRQTP